MAAQLIPDKTWEQITAILPPTVFDPAGGRPPVGDREVLTGVLFVLKTGIAWQDLPKEMGCGCGMTCLRRLRKWQEHGVWDQIQEILKAGIRQPGRYDWSRSLVTTEARQRRNPVDQVIGAYPRYAQVPAPPTREAELSDFRARTEG